MQCLFGRNPLGGVHGQKFLELDQKLKVRIVFFREYFGNIYPRSRPDAHQQKDLAVRFYFMLLHVFDEAAVGVPGEHEGMRRENILIAFIYCRTF